MNEKYISFTIPNEAPFLAATAHALLAMAGEPVETGVIRVVGGEGAVADDNKKEPPVAKVQNETNATEATVTVATEKGLREVPAEKAETVNTEAPTPGTQESTNIAAGITLDKNGLPWDTRVHSSSKKMTAKGVWARRRNVPEETVTKVEAELRQVMGMGTTTTAPASEPEQAQAAPPVSPPAEQQQEADPKSIFAQSDVESGEATAPATEETQAAPPVSPPAEQTASPEPEETQETGAVDYTQIKDFATLVSNITQYGVSQEKVSEALAAAKVPSLPTLAARADLIPTVAALIWG